MIKQIHIFRHSNGEHELPDFAKTGKPNNRAKLTDQGIEAAYQSGLVHGLSANQELIGVWSSPRIRAIQTSLLHAYANLVPNAKDFVDNNPDDIAVRVREIFEEEHPFYNGSTPLLDYDWQKFIGSIDNCRKSGQGLDYLLSKHGNYVELRVKAQRALLHRAFRRSANLDKDANGYICGHSSDIELLLLSLSREFGTVDDHVQVMQNMDSFNGFRHNEGYTLTQFDNPDFAVVNYGDVFFDFPITRLSAA